MQPLQKSASAFFVHLGSIGNAVLLTVHAAATKREINGSYAAKQSDRLADRSADALCDTKYPGIHKSHSPRRACTNTHKKRPRPRPENVPNG